MRMHRVVCLLFRVLLSLAATAPGFVAHADDAPPPVSDFFSAEAMSPPVLSPFGKFLAVRMANAQGRRQLAVITLEPARQAKVVAKFVDADVADVHWVNDDRLAFNINDLQSAFADGFSPGLFAVDRIGENLRPLVQRGWRFVVEARTFVSRELPFNHRFLRVLRDGSADVLIERMNFDHGYRELVSTTPLRLNTLTGRASGVDIGLAESVQNWLFDDVGIAHAAVSLAKGQQTVHWRAKPEQSWSVISSGPAFSPKPGNFWPWSWGADGELYVVAPLSNQERTNALLLFHSGTGHVASQPVVSLQGFDFSGELIFSRNTKALLGARYTSDATDTAWFDPAMRALQAKIDQRLPGVINLLAVAECGCSHWLLVTSYSHRQSPLFSL